MKVPINGGFSCPNRDGTLSSSGCTFCDNRSFSPVAETIQSPLEQLRAFMRCNSTTGAKFIAYLQPFSNTYGPLTRLREVYEPLIEEPGVAGLAVGTRPDCLHNDIFEYLADVARRTYLSVELGLQSSHDQTLKQINRGHTYEDFRGAVNRLSSLGIETVAHVMIGFAGEDEEMICETARRLASMPVNGVKVHQLMIIDKTALADQYREGTIEALSLERYTALVGAFLSCLRPDQHIHRIMADSHPRHGLIAPLWSADKARSLAHITAYFERCGVWQGASYSGIQESEFRSRKQESAKN